MCLAGATQLRSIRISGPASSLCGPQGTRKVTLSRGRHATVDQTSAAHRSAAMAGGARPDPFRTRKLSRRAPMVLRGKPVGEQGAADRWTALDPFSRARARGRRGGGIPSRRPLSHNSVLLSRPSVFPLQREMRRAFPMLAVLGAMRPIGPVVPRWRSPVPGRIPPRRHIPPLAVPRSRCEAAFPSGAFDWRAWRRPTVRWMPGRDGRERSVLARGRPVTCRARHMPDRAASISPSMPGAPVLPEDMGCLRLTAGMPRPTGPASDTATWAMGAARLAPPACAARAWGRARVPGSRGMVPMGCRRRRAGRLLALTAPLMPI